jgi:hypothetical protein
MNDLGNRGSQLGNTQSKQRPQNFLYTNIVVGSSAWGKKNEELTKRYEHKLYPNVRNKLD